MAGRNRQLKTPNGKIGAWISKSPAKSQAVWKQDTLEGLDKGSRVWYKAGVNSWVLGTLQALHVGLWTVALDSEAGEGTGQASTFSNTFPAAPEKPAHPNLSQGSWAMCMVTSFAIAGLSPLTNIDGLASEGLVNAAGHQLQAGVAGACQPCDPGRSARSDRPHIPE